MINDYKTLDAMELYGGSFASAIAVAAQRADHFNYTRLKKAFPDLWKEYAAMAEQLERNREETHQKFQRDNERLQSMSVRAAKTRGSEEDSQ